VKGSELELPNPYNHLNLCNIRNGVKINMLFSFEARIKKHRDSGKNVYKPKWSNGYRVTRAPCAEGQRLE